MPITYVVDREVGVIHEKWSGEVDAAELGDYWRGYLSDSAVLDLRATLVDMRSAEIQFTGAELKSLIASVVNPVLEGRSWLTAIVVDHPVQFGVSRQYHAFAEHYSEDAIFSDPEAAMGWLLQHRTAG
jgi:hypothetical protein